VLQEGDYELPAVKVVWWDTAAGKVRKAVAPEPESEAPAQEPRTSWWDMLRRNAAWMACGIALILLFAFLARRYAPRLARWRREAAERRMQSEEAYFERLARDLRSGEPHAAYSELLRWQRRTCRIATEDPELAHKIDALAARLYSTPQPGSWSGTKLLTLLQRDRKRRVLSTTTGIVLAPLNPRNPNTIPTINPVQ
jgi:hypothetical protein